MVINKYKTIFQYFIKFGNNLLLNNGKIFEGLVEEGDYKFTLFSELQELLEKLNSIDQLEKVLGNEGIKLKLKDEGR